MRRFKKKYALNKEISLSKLNQQRALCIQYGLKNKKELARYSYLVNKYEKNYPATVKKDIDAKLKSLGLDSINVRSFLERRLQTVIAKKYGYSMKKSRQLITHGKVKIEGKRKRFPGYLVRLSSVSKIVLENVSETPLTV